MRAFLLAIVIFAVLSGTARAGAWMRGEGTGFVSASVQLTWPQDMSQLQSREPADQYQAIYFEYGVAERLTLGLDLGRSVAGADKVIAFAQLPLRNRDTGMKASVALGFGTIGDQRVLRPGLSLGWGLKRGWVSAESVAEISIQSGETDLKLDMTWGRSFESGRKLIVQLQTGAPSSNDAFARLAPSMVFSVTPRIKAEAGVSWGLKGDQSMGIKLGLWAEF